MTRVEGGRGKTARAKKTERKRKEGKGKEKKRRQSLYVGKSGDVFEESLRSPPGNSRQKKDESSGVSEKAGRCLSLQLPRRAQFEALATDRKPWA